MSSRYEKHTPMKRMVKDKLHRKVLGQLEDCMSEKGSDQVRSGFHDRFIGEPLEGDAKLKSAHRSTFQATDVSDIVLATRQEMLDVLASDEQLVEFRAETEADEDAAAQETGVIHHLFANLNNSYEILDTWITSGLIEQNAYVRSGWVEQTKVRLDDYEDLTHEQFVEITQKIMDSGGDYDIEELEGVTMLENGLSAPIPNDVGEVSISCRIRRVETVKLYEIDPVPQDEFFITSQWTKVSLDKCPVHGHKSEKTASELLAMGFSKESVRKLADNDSDNFGKFERHATSNNYDGTNDKQDETKTIVEGYVYLEDDKENRFFKVWANEDGTKLMKWEDGEDAIEEVEGSPFSAWSPYPVPHRHNGRSAAELAAPTQALKTHQWRTMLDCMTATNYPRPIVDVNMALPETYADILLPSPGAAIRTDGPAAIEWTKPPQILGDVLPLMDRADSDLVKNAGVTQYAQGLNMDSLGKSQIGSEGIQSIMDSGQKRIKTILRTFAETGLRSLFLKMHADMRRGPYRELSVKLHDEWVHVEPLKWRERTDMMVTVGNKERKVEALSFVLTEIKEMLASGAPNVHIAHHYEAVKRLTKELGIKSIEPFMVHPMDQESMQAIATPPPPPDPMIEVQMAMAQAEQAKADADMAKVQSDREVKMADIQLKGRELQTKYELAELEAAKADAEIKIRMAELEIKRAEFGLKDAELAHKIETDDEDRDDQRATIDTQAAD